MADTKISALTAATTPLAGTEVLPIVQSSVTKQVSIANLTIGRTVEVGNLSVSGSTPRITADMSSATLANRLNFQNSVANSTTSVGVIPSGTGTSSRLNLFNSSDPDNAGYLQAQISATNAIFNSSKTGTGTALPYVWQIASSTYLSLGTSGDLTISSGNLIQGTAAKGINFTANTAAAGMTSQLLNWYEEGTWTPNDASGAGLGLTNVSGFYTRVGRQVTCLYRVVYPTTASIAGATIGGLPFNIGAAYATGYTGYNSGTGTVINHRTNGATSFFVSNAATGATLTNAQMSTIQIQGVFIYFI